MLYFVIKALHIIFVVTWFAGLFYIVRLFIYAAEANTLEDLNAKKILLDQYAIMKRRLWYGITWPSAILTLIFGVWMAVLYGSLPLWLILKFGLVACLYFYHFSCQKLYKQQSVGDYRYSSYQLRIWNEVATLFLFAIVFVVVLKDLVGFWSILAGLAILALLLFVSVKIYAKSRK